MLWCYEAILHSKLCCTQCHPSLFRNGIPQVFDRIPAFWQYSRDLSKSVEKIVEVYVCQWFFSRPFWSSLWASKMGCFFSVKWRNPFSFGGCMAAPWTTPEASASPRTSVPLQTFSIFLSPISDTARPVYFRPLGCCFWVLDWAENIKYLFCIIFIRLELKVTLPRHCVFMWTGQKGHNQEWWYSVLVLVKFIVIQFIAKQC